MSSLFCFVSLLISSMGMEVESLLATSRRGTCLWMLLAVVHKA